MGLDIAHAGDQRGADAFGRAEQHQRGLELAGVVDAGKGALADGAEFLGGEPPPGQEGDAAVAMLRAESLQQHLADRLVAAMAVEQHDVAEAVASDAFKDVADIGQEGLVADAERAGEIHMVLGAADFHLRQDQDPIAEALLERLQEMVADDGVGLQRQMRAVLLDRRDVQHDRDVAIERGDFVGRQGFPTHGVSSLFRRSCGRRRGSGRWRLRRG